MQQTRARGRLPAKGGDVPSRGRRNPEAASYSFILVIYLFQRRTAAVLDTDHWVGAFSQGHSTRHKSAVRPSGLHETKWGFSFLQWEQGLSLIHIFGASIIGVVLLALCILTGPYVAAHPETFGWLDIDKKPMSILIPMYGFAASVLPLSLIHISTRGTADRPLRGTSTP